MEEVNKRLLNIIRHIEHVRSNGIIIAEKLIESGDEFLGRKLIETVHVHDHSKFNGIEWLYLNDETKAVNPELFNTALLAHTKNNPHHPEYWNGLENMPKLYIAEFVCDIKARSTEFGTDIRLWLKETATTKYKITSKSKVYKEINFFLNLLLEKPF